MPRHRRSERDDILTSTRQRLLAAATVAFARWGYARANVDDISKAAGFAKGTIYNYFRSKRDVMLALIHDISGQHLDYVAGQVGQEGSPERRLRRFFEAGFAFVSDYLPQAQVMVNNLYGPDAEFKEAMYRAYLPMFALVAEEIVAPGVRAGVFRAVDPQETANLLMTTYLGIASQVDAQGKPWLSAAVVADFVLNGLRAEQ